MSDVFMPRLSDTMEEGVIARWTKQVGDTVKAGETIAEVDTDKATMDLEVFEDGVIQELLAAEGETVAIGTAVAVLGSGTGDGTGTTTAVPSSAGQAEEGGGPAEQSDQQPGARILMSPLARRIAVEHGIDPTTLQGSGPGGRVVRRDVEDAIAPAGSGGRTRPAEPSAPEAPPVPDAGTATSPAPPSSDDEFTEVPLTQMRKATARRLTESAAVPHFDLTVAVTADPLLAFRADINARMADEGIKVSVTDLLIRACAVTLRRHPMINSSWAEDKILQHHRVHIGLAVAIEAGLIVPVIRDADIKGLAALSQESRELAEKARAGKLKPAEFSGGGFTISNLGMFGIEHFTAVINPPEAAILAVGASSETPYVEDGELRSRKVMRLTLTSDHRVLDGAVSAAFLKDLKETLEEPLRILL